MHPEVLTKEQKDLLQLLKKYRKDFFLVGGTAIALYLGHRLSIDFDLFSEKPFDANRIMRDLKKSDYPPEAILQKEHDQITCVLHGVKCTFLEFPWGIPHEEAFEDYFCMPTLLDLAAMKAFAMGKRSKYKDYVDLYFILKEHYSLEAVAARAGELFAGQFNEKLFRIQLSYFEDIDYSEEVVYVSAPVDQKEVFSYLAEVSVR